MTRCVTSSRVQLVIVIILLCRKVPLTPCLPSSFFLQGAGIRSSRSSAVRCTTKQKIRPGMLCTFSSCTRTHVLCTAVHASVQHRISLYTSTALHRQKFDRGRELERGRINGTLRYMYQYYCGMDRSECDLIQTMMQLSGVRWHVQSQTWTEHISEQLTSN